MANQPNTFTVYAHVNKTNGKRYIGMTGLPIEKRWKNGYGYSLQKKFFDDITAFGWDGFDHIIVADGLTEQEAHKMERELIDKYQTTNPEFGYNTNRGVGDLTQEVVCIETGTVYPNVKVAAAELNLSVYSCIIRVLNDFSKKCQKMHWATLEYIEEHPDEVAALKKNTNAFSPRVKNRTAWCVEMQKQATLEEFAEQLSTSVYEINRIIDRTSRTCKGYHFTSRRLEKGESVPRGNKGVGVKNVETGEIFPSITAVVNKFDFEYNAFYRYLQKAKNPKYSQIFGGYHWKVVD